MTVSRGNPASKRLAGLRISRPLCTRVSLVLGGLGAAERPQLNQCRSPSPVLRMVQGERDDRGVAAQNRMHAPAKRAGSFAVDNPNLENSPCPARRQIVRDEVFNLAGLKRMEVENPINRNLDWLVHGTLEM